MSETNEPKWIQIARGELGQREVRGGENPRIIEYHRATTLKATEDEVPWCSAFMNWVLWHAGCEITRSAAALSWLKYGPVSKQFKKNSIVVFTRGHGLGHVAFAMEDKGDYIKCLGGNQSDSVCFALYRKANVLGYVWPRPLKKVSGNASE